MKRSEQNKPKILVVLGPTASGKSDLAVWLAKKFNGEVISADSRQVYKGLDIGTGKITKKEMSGIPHHLLDVVSPRNHKNQLGQFSVSQYKRKAEQAIKEILKKGKLPILCGGTGFYIQAIVDDLILPEVKPDKKLRKNLEKKSVEELFVMLKKLDPRRAKDIDSKNPRRLIRAIEIAKTIGKSPILNKTEKNTKYDVLEIGIKIHPQKLKKNIEKRLASRLKKGMITEVKRLHDQRVSWKRLDSFGLEYRHVAQYLQKKISKKEMSEKLNSEIWKYSKRQITWFKKDKRIKWISTKKEVQNLTKNFLKD